MVPSRKSHKKSRTGCITCKIRKIKCDETHPSCLNCSRRSTECVYNSVIQKRRSSKKSKAVTSAVRKSISSLALSPVAFCDGSSVEISPAGSSPQDSWQSEQPSGEPSGGSNLQQTEESSFEQNVNGDLSNITNVKTAGQGQSSTVPNVPSEYADITETTFKLTSFILSDLVYIITSDPEEQIQWQSLIQSSFFGNQNLKHCLMAVASLHKYTVAPSSEKSPLLLAISQYHYTKCVSNFKDSLTPKTYDDTFIGLCVAILLCVYLAASKETNIHDPMFFKMVRGVHAMFDRAVMSDFFRLSPVIIDKYSPSTYQSISLDSSVTSPQYLRDLCQTMPFENLIESVSSKPDLQDFTKLDFRGSTPVYNGKLIHEALYSTSVDNILRQYHFLFHNIDTQDYLPILVRWVLSTPKEFAFLLSVDDPRSLIIAAHFILLLLSMKTMWWTENANNELKEIFSKLPQCWKKWLAVKFKEVESTMFVVDIENFCKS